VKIAFKVGNLIDLSWDDFESYFSKSYSYSQEKFSQIQYTLIGVGVYHGGGGLEPEYVLTASKSEMEQRFQIPPHMIPPSTDLPNRDQVS
jgi:hypothetical protein